MQTINEAYASTAFVSQADHDAAQASAAAATASAVAKRSLAETIAAKHNETVQAAKLANQPANRQQRRANGKAAAKRVAAKPATAAKQPAKPTAEARQRAQADQADARRLERQAAARAVGAYYSGASKPFKAASDRFADLNPANAKAPSTRQAALMLALIVHGAGNMRSDGSFVRGGFRVPARLVNANAPADATVSAQPESGCLGNMLGRTVDHTAGPTSGREQREATFRLRIKAALAEIQTAFGDAVRDDAAKRLASFPRPGRRAA